MGIDIVIKLLIEYYIESWYLLLNMDRIQAELIRFSITNRFYLFLISFLLYLWLGLYKIHFISVEAIIIIN